MGIFTLKKTCAERKRFSPDCSEKYQNSRYAPNPNKSRVIILDLPTR